VFLTVTPNVALDVTYEVERLDLGAVNRVGPPAIRPGGKGLNVARVLHQLGEPVTVLGFVGGATGDDVIAGLQARGLPSRLVHVPGATRRCLALHESSTGAVTELNERGPEVDADAWSALGAALSELLPVEGVALCGSLPPGSRADAYGPLVQACRAAGVPVLLDTSGVALRRGVEARPDVVKPNRAELAELSGLMLDDAGIAAAVPAARQLHERTGGTVVASLGRAGLVGVGAAGSGDSAVWHASVPAVAGNTVGAGDAVVAGLLRGCARNHPLPEVLTEAAALGAAAVRCPTAGEIDLDAYHDLLAAVRLTPVAEHP
jgi:tagatose 6-phosphate kinase